VSTDPLAHLNESIIRKEQIAAGKIFISYSRRNREFAKALYAKLHRMGFTLWRDVHDIEAGAEDWWQSIQDAIHECETMVLCMSMASLKSSVVSDEWFYARQQGKRIIPVVVEDIWDHPEVKAGTFTIPNWMRRRNWLDFRTTIPEADAAWANLLRTLNERYIPKRFLTMVEALPPRFVRRPDDLDRAIRGLVDDKNDAVAMTTALNGAGGYGKTTLAKAIARDLRIQGAFDDGILWVTLGEKLVDLQGEALETILKGRVRELIHALTGETPVIESLEMANAKLHAALGDLYVLLVIDDVWDEAHLKPFLLDTKRAPHSACLITTRSLNAVSSDTILKQTVDKMTPIEAAELLGAGFDADEIKNHDVTLRQLARDLREYPLLLALANTQIANFAHDMGLSLTDALQLAAETLQEQGALGFDETNSEDRNKAVSNSLEVSIRQLKPTERQRLYRELAIFPHNAVIPLTTLEKYWGLSKIATLQFCQLLYRKTALLRSFEGMAVRIHDVYCDCLIRFWMPEQQRELHRRLTDNWGVIPGVPITTLLDVYTWRNLAYHLIEGEQIPMLRTLLFDYHFLRAKLDATDVNVLIAACDALLYLRKEKSVQILRSAFLLSWHILAKDKAALGHELVGRLMKYRVLNPELRAFTEAIPSLQPGLYPVEFDSPYGTHTQAGGALLRTLSGHTGRITGALVLGDGRLFSWSEDNTLRLWTADGTPLAVLQGHTGGITGALILGDGRLLSWSTDCTLRLWAANGTPLVELRGHTDWVLGTLASDDGRLLESQVLKVREGSVLGALALEDGRLLSWSADSTLRLWTADGVPLAELRGHTDWVLGALALEDGRLLSWSADSTLRLWTADGVPLAVLQRHHE